MATTARSAAMPHVGWGWVLAYGLVSIAIGVLALVWPFSASLAAAFVFGVMLIVGGAASLVSALAGRAREGRGYALLFGLVSLAIGLLVTFNPLAGAISITMLAVVWLLLRGALEIGWGLRFRRNRAWMILLGVANILIAGFILWTIPVSALTLPGVLLGVSFLLGGITATIDALALREGDAAVV